jgi:hypothetical protein
MHSIELSDGSILKFVPVHKEVIRVDAIKPECGVSFEGVAEILTIEGYLPSIQIPKGLGPEAAQAVIDHAKQISSAAA